MDVPSQRYRFPKWAMVFILMVYTMSHPLNAQEDFGDLIKGLRNRCMDLHNLTISGKVTETVVGTKPQNLELVPDKPREFVVSWEVVKGDSKTGFPWMDFEIRTDGANRFLSVRMPQMGQFNSSRETPGKVTLVQRSWNQTVGMSLIARSGAVLASRQLHVLSNPIFRFLDIPVSDVDLREQQHTFLPGSIDWKSAISGPQEIVSGLNCSVIEVPGHDKLWVARNHGFALVKREVRGPGGLIESVLTTDGWIEVSKGDWLPQRIEREFWKPTNDGKVVLATRVVLDLNFERKELGPSAFQIDFPIGTHVDNEIEGSTYVVGGNPFVKSGNQINNVFYKYRLYVLVALNIVAAAVTFIIVRKMRLRKRGVGDDATSQQ